MTIEFEFLQEYPPAHNAIPPRKGRLNFLNKFQVGDLLEPKGNGQYAVKADTRNPAINLTPFCNILDIYPKEFPDIPSDLPAEIQDMYSNDLTEILNSPKHVVIECRSIIETACKDRLQKTSGNLKKMIDELVTQSILPEIVAEWAHTIRMIANENVHGGEKSSPDEANELLEFTTILLELLYSYPARIKRLKADKAV